MNSVIPVGHGPWRRIACSTMMSPSSYAVFRSFTFVAASQLLAPWTFGFSLSFKLIELVGQQDLTSWRAYSHVHIASCHEFPRLLQRFRSCGASNIDARKLIVSADKELQLRRASHARQSPQRSAAKKTVARLPVARSSRSCDAGTHELLSLRRERSLPSVTDRSRGEAR